MQPTIIIVAGASGSGKSEVVKRIAESVGPENCEIIDIDRFYKDRSNIPVEERHRVNYDHPDAIEWFELVHAIMCLKEGKEVQIPYYDFDTHTRVPDKARTAHPKPYIIIDGLMALWHEKLRELADYKFFVEAGLDICFVRRQKRDTSPVEKGGHGRTNESVRQQWPQVGEACILFFEPTKRHADIIIPKGGFNKIAISIITSWIKHLLTQNLAP